MIGFHCHNSKLVFNEKLVFCRFLERKGRSEERKKEIEKMEKGMTAGRRGETERNAFERSHEFTSKREKKEMNYEAYFLCLSWSMSVFSLYAQ